MKKHLMIFVVMLFAVAIAMPALAAVEFKYGGQFRVRSMAEDNVRDGTELNGFYNNFDANPTTANSKYNSDDNRRFIDQRLRLYFSFIASKNLKVVTKFEVGDTVWGNPGTRVGAGSGGGVGADGVSVEVKNAYVEFNIPQTPSTAIVGIQSLVLLDSWIVDDDFSAAVLVTKLDPFRVTLGYVAGQYGWEKNFVSSPSTVTGAKFLPFTAQDANIDSVFMSLDYADGPFKGSVVGFYQNGHRSTVSADPTTLSTPSPTFNGLGNNDFTNSFNGQQNIDQNNLFDLGFNFTYKVDWLLAYVNFVKNFGSVDFNNPVSVPALVTPTNPNGIASGLNRKSSVDYTGFMIDAGVTYFCGPWTANLGGFYTTGPDISNNPNQNNTFGGISSTEINWFTYPLATAKYFSEIIGGGVLGDDMYAYRGYKNGVTASNIGSASGLNTVYWRGYGFPTNLWTLTAGGSYQIAESTKVSASYWYFGTSESVPVAFERNAAGLRTGKYLMSDSIGHELNFYLDQGIVDGLTLTLVGAYLIADDAFAPLPVNVSSATGDARYNVPQADNAFELGARLQWNF